ncbi:MAG: hypothetical protein A2Z05_04395 [Chloroflexi bacterium RBG_16_60_22]|nr:MAG: hypothetical protein A2Z05_04395 [Chloroflexi bacterium RBG_16_60_22]
MDELQWNKDRLYRLVQSKLGDSLFIVVSNREPYVHSLSGREIKWNRPVSGLTEALDPVMRASGGTWVAQGTGDADRKVVDKHDRVAVPPDNPEYTLRRVWLTEDEVAGFYLGFSNEGLWPLCHVTFTPPVFNEADWQTYQKVNSIFADAVIKEIGDRPAVVLVQDYHFALLSHYLKERNPGLTVGQFWHIPWPAYEVLRTCPWHQEILVGMLGNDLMGFHTQAFCNNFIESVERSLEARTVREEDTIFRQGNTTVVEPFPISVDFDGISEAAGSAAVEKEMAALKKEFHLEGKYLGIGMDRLDYTKGIPERLLALDRFLEDNPEYRGRVVFIQAGMPSRTQIDTYKKIGQRGNDLMGFHTQAFCNNFIESVERSLEARTVREEDTIFRQGNTTVVEPFPISVDFDGISEAAGSAAVEKEMAALKKEFHLEGKYLGIGMDRLDYTKGIPERLLALDRFLEDNPEYRGRVVFIQAGMPSRTQIDTYKKIGQRIDDLMAGINKKYGTDAWQPVVPMTRQLSHDTLNALRRLARFCVVSSLHDGMNLVAKEFVAARVDGDGVLILSKFTGAAVEMRNALLINPYAIGEFALKIKEAIEMPEAERRRRMARMRDIVSANNIYRWGASMVARLIEIAGV